MGKVKKEFCSVDTCKSVYYKQKCDELRFFTFPKDPTLKNQWITKCHSQVKLNFSYARVCGLHFTEDDFEDIIRAKVLNVAPKKLKKSAVPSQRLHSSQMVKERVSKHVKDKERREMIDDLLKSHENEVKEKEEIENVKKKFRNRSKVVIPPPPLPPPPKKDFSSFILVPCPLLQDLDSFGFPRQVVELEVEAFGQVIDPNLLSHLDIEIIEPEIPVKLEETEISIPNEVTNNTLPAQNTDLEKTIQVLENEKRVLVEQNKWLIDKTNALQGTGWNLKAENEKLKQEINDLKIKIGGGDDTNKIKTNS